jgi:hypothetical protein
LIKDKRKPNLLIVGDYKRKDHLDLFLKSRDDFNFYFIEYASDKEVDTHHHLEYGQVLYWKDFAHSFDLLDKIRPVKVLFFFIESYYHIVLNLTCKATGIPSYHIDHGIRDINVNVRLAPYYKARRGASHLYRNLTKFKQLKHRLQTRLFLVRSLKRLPAEYAGFAKMYMQIRRRNTYYDTYKVINSPLRIADAYISFSPKTFETHKIVDALPENTINYFIGIPTFDSLANILADATTGKAIIFIDQGFVDEGTLGWDISKYRTLVTSLSTVCSNHGYKIFVKPHPKQVKGTSKFWEQIHNATLIDNKELVVILPSIRLIIGFYSTYLLPLIALPFTTVATLENHPIGKIDVSKSFIEAGVAHPIYDLEELNSILTNVEELHQKQLPNKAKFTEEWMYKFDGKAGERLRDILLSDEL